MAERFAMKRVRSGHIGEACGREGHWCDWPEGRAPLIHKVEELGDRYEFWSIYPCQGCGVLFVGERLVFGPEGGGGLMASMPERERVLEILRQNESKPFVQRILHQERYPKLDLGKGEYATHKMSWASVETDQGKKFRVFPLVRQEGEKLREYGWRDAMRRSQEAGDYIDFDDQFEADWFSKRYKLAWED